MECNDDTGAMILLHIKSNIVFSYTLHHAGSDNGGTSVHRRRDRARNLAGRAGRPSFSSDLSERIDYNIPDLPIYARRDALSSFPGLPLPMSLASRSGIHPCHQRSDAIFRQRRHSDAGSRQRIGRQFEPGCITGSRRSRGNAGSPAWWSTQNCLSCSARMSGFSSASYFINVFRRRRGVTPRVWRESRCVGRVTVRGSRHRARRHAQ